MDDATFFQPASDFPTLLHNAAVFESLCQVRYSILKGVIYKTGESRSKPQTTQTISIPKNITDTKTTHAP